MMNIRSILMLVTLAALVLADRVTKYLAIHLWATPYVVNRLVTLQLVYNRGISWGMLHTDTPMGYGIVTLLVLSVLSIFCWYIVQQYRTGHAIGIPLMIAAGALSNVYDRLLYPGVIDCITVHIGDWYWPVFNIADCMISIGIGILLVRSHRQGAHA